MEEALRELAARLGAALTGRGWMLGCAESCTGGLLSSVLTDTPGSSAWFAGAVVSYTNDVKRDVLGVSQEILDTVGAVSRETVLAMARGARGVLMADVGVAISGIAGPAGGTPQKPVGTVWIAWQSPDAVSAEHFQFTGDRQAVRQQAVREAMLGVLALAERFDAGN
ncbi:CinA domain protein [Solidesulfovibrio fructosivorans JJ]]|uniref:CinA domain protein n=1 Tax=Solidesulfovibrio fructosivorans JJ] TaxID=596151 RepID=E1K1C0_SOLFR|nr:CinA family protein [Solidesulfovibrio fructosivorans]EFL49606.1 CinA domain protein [Solidesulfovibrio fructosivorans JJ]]